MRCVLIFRPGTLQRVAFEYVKLKNVKPENLMLIRSRVLGVRVHSRIGDSPMLRCI